jgi:hypoxanthine-DNA glycosylase
MRPAPESSPVPGPVRQDGLAPCAAPDARVLVLGSFPGQRSLAQQQYYGHPHNQFWPIMRAIFGCSAYCENVSSYQNKIAWLTQNGVAVWDVYASCERHGSLDSAIRAAQLNDLAGLMATLPQLRLVAHNGAESYKHAHHTRALGLPVVRLPSTSPANATWSLARKTEAWRAALAQAGLPR